MRGHCTIASPPPASAETLAAGDVADASVTLHGAVNPFGSMASVFFEYGTTTDYGQVVDASPAIVDELIDQHEQLPVRLLRQRRVGAAEAEEAIAEAQRSSAESSA